MLEKAVNVRQWLSKITTIVVLLLLVSGLYYLATRPVSSGLYVRFLDVGQGDAELIQTAAGQNVLIDGGPDETVISRLDSYIPFYARKLNAVILSHPHADHVAGLNSVLDKYQVEHVYFSGVAYTTPSYLELLEKLKVKNVATTAVKKGDKLDLGNGIIIDFLYPLTSQVGMTSENINNGSVVARLTYGDEAALFMGDLEMEGQQKLLGSGQKIQSDLYKTPHHGSKDSAYQNFYDSIKAKFVVIEVGKDNKFGHPTQKALGLYRLAQIFRTDEVGDISFEVGEHEIRRLK